MANTNSILTANADICSTWDGMNASANKEYKRTGEGMNFCQFYADVLYGRALNARRLLSASCFLRSISSTEH